MPMWEDNTFSSLQQDAVTDTELQKNWTLINKIFTYIKSYGLHTRSSYYSNARVSPVTTSFNVSALQGANQYIGIISSASPGAITGNMPLPSTMTTMDSFIFCDESDNSNTYPITLQAQGQGGTAKFYGQGLSSSGETSLIINKAGAMVELIYVTANIYRVKQNKSDYFT